MHRDCETCPQESPRLNLAISDLRVERELREFIADTFKRHYDARLDTYCNTLVGVRAEGGQLQAAAGYNLADEGPLFLEQYLDEGIEQRVYRQLSWQIDREDIAEVGNLAAAGAGGTRLLVRVMTQHLHRMGRRWVVFTATQSLINSFHRLGLQPIALAPAMAEKVKCPQAWGRYYEQKPWVVIGDIAQGYAQLEGLNQLIPAECLQ
ncbi:thermostable hemolysin [Limnobacter humi]|uniref:Thermostable hemolysin n=1 Tax=Limnobacter humi TaxID=1778671 RepID=A0ABT1WKK3_9BURK|nr:thermostable hemolysin [Limnobacter humi]MCQ8897711.1 thermostable hemolysin [Limnobacter humi]